jgi:beta-aspartyl-peptidase (threonine type)
MIIMTWCILVNGRPIEKGILDATRLGGNLLDEGYCSLDVVESTIKFLEDHSSFDAGTGCEINFFGDILMDASIMDGRSLKAGGVGAIRKIKNPISLARKVLEFTPNVLLVGKYAEKFASFLAKQDKSLIVDYFAGTPQTVANYNLMKKKLVNIISDNYIDDYYSFLLSEDSKNVFDQVSVNSGTVSVTVRDNEGNFASGASTGGWPHIIPGRIGDSPLIGCGAYADNLIGAASTSGIRGEENIRLGGLTRKICDLMYSGLTAQKAVENVTEYSRKRLGLVLKRGSLIAIDKDGETGVNNVHSAASQGVGLMRSSMSEAAYFT